MSSDLNVEQAETEAEENPFNIKNLSDLGQYYVSRGDLPAAIRTYDRILRTSEENAKAWLALGHCYLIRKDYLKCVSAYQKVLLSKEEASGVDFWYGVGLLLFVLEDWKNAFRVFEGILEVKKDFLYTYDIFYKLGHCKAREKDFALAVGYLEKGLNIEGVDEKTKKELFSTLCEAWSGLNSEENLKTCYGKALAGVQDLSKIVKIVSWDLHKRKKYKESTEVLTEFVKKSKPNSEIFYLIGRNFHSQLDYENARLNYSEALSLNQSSFIYWASAGILYGEYGQYSDSFDCFNKSLSICQESCNIWHNIAVLYTLCDQKQEADLSFQRSKLFPQEELLTSFTHPAFCIADPIYSQPVSEALSKASQDILSLADKTLTKEVLTIINSLKTPEVKEQKPAEIVVPKVASAAKAQNPAFISQSDQPRPDVNPQAAMIQSMMMNPMMFYQILYRNMMNLARQAEEEKAKTGDDQGARTLLDMNSQVKREREGSDGVESPVKKMKEENE